MAKNLLTARHIQAVFLAKAEAKHATFVPAYNALKILVENQGGHFSGDHIALRTTDDRVAEILIQAGSIMNLHRPADELAQGIKFPYRFPDKRLKSFDLLGELSRDLKLFVSVWDEDATESREVIAAIKEDREAKYRASEAAYHALLELVEKAMQAGGLTAEEAETFAAIMVDNVLTRNGSHLKESHYRVVAQESGELASAMVLGEGINHFTVDVRESGFTSTEALRVAAAEAGMKVLPTTSGREGWLLQSATVAAEEAITLLGEDGSMVKAVAPLRFMEFIYRPELKDSNGKAMLESDGKPELYRRFEQTNAHAIFSAASVK